MDLVYKKPSDYRVIHQNSLTACPIPLHITLLHFYTFGKLLHFLLGLSSLLVLSK